MESENALTVIDEAYETPINTRGINLSRIETRLDLVKEATKTLPTNEFNLPTYIYRTDLLHENMLEKLDDMLTSATVYLDYHHGFPTIKNDQPFWSRLEWEPQAAFEAFLQYLELAGGRTLRQIDTISPDLLLQYYHMYYWGQRALAYDMYLTAHHARLRHRRIFEVEDTHWKASAKLFAKLDKAVSSIGDEALAEVEPEKLIKMLATAAQIQRASVGLSTTGGGKESADGAKAPSVEVIMRQVAENAGVQPTEEHEVDFAALYNDPEALKVAQTLIIKVTR